MDYKQLKKREKLKKRGVEVPLKPDISAPKRKDTKMNRYYTAVIMLMTTALLLGAALIYQNAYRIEDSFRSIKKSVSEKLPQKEDSADKELTDELDDGFSIDMGDIDLPDEIKIKGESEDGEESVEKSEENTDESEQKEYNFDTLPTVEPPNTYQ